MKILITCYHPTDDKTTHMEKTLLDYTEWCIRGLNFGFKPRKITDDVVQFISNVDGDKPIFTARFVEDGGDSNG